MIILQPVTTTLPRNVPPHTVSQDPASNQSPDHEQLPTQVSGSSQLSLHGLASLQVPSQVPLMPSSSKLTSEVSPTSQLPLVSSPALTPSSLPRPPLQVLSCNSQAPGSSSTTFAVYLQSQGRRIHTSRGDGNCLFQSLSAG